MRRCGGCSALSGGSVVEKAGRVHVSTAVVTVIQGQPTIFVSIVSQVQSHSFLAEEFDDATTAAIHVDSKA